MVKPVEKASWLHPPSEVLKLNFNGSFRKEQENRGISWGNQGQLRSNLTYLLRAS